METALVYLLAVVGAVFVEKLLWMPYVLLAGIILQHVARVQVFQISVTVVTGWGSALAAALLTERLSAPPTLWIYLLFGLCLLWGDYMRVQSSLSAGRDDIASIEKHFVWGHLLGVTVAAVDPWLSSIRPNLFPWLSVLVLITVAVACFVLLPLANRTATRQFSSTALLVASFVLGVTLWMNCLLYTSDAADE